MEDNGWKVESVDYARSHDIWLRHCFDMGTRDTARLYRSVAREVAKAVYKHDDLGVGAV